MPSSRPSWSGSSSQRSPLQGLQIRVIAERIATHEYEAFVLAPLFSALTGIRVILEISGEDDVVN